MTISSIRKWICLAGLGCLAGCLMMDILGGHAPGVVLSPSQIPNEHLTRGRLNGKYSDPIHVLWSPRDSMELGALADGGYWNGGRWAQVPNNPAGYWVYVDPYWIVYRSTSARSFPGGSFSGVWESNVGRMTIALQQRTVLGSWTNPMGTWRFEGTVDGNRINVRWEDEMTYRAGWLEVSPTGDLLRGRWDPPGYDFDWYARRISSPTEQLTSYPPAAPPASSPGLSPTSGMTFSGSWKTEQGELSFTQTGDRVEGQCPFIGEAWIRIRGQLRGSLLSFTWHIPGGEGEGWFTLSNDGRAFTGQWNVKGVWHEWNGTRIGAAPSAGAGPKQPGRNTLPGGYYAVENSLEFNVLERVVFEPENERIILMGRRDDRYGELRIPYLQHLATLLENPSPKFSLDWTPDSERMVDAFLEKLDSEDYMAQLAANWAQPLDNLGRVTPLGREFLRAHGIRPTRNGKALGRLGVRLSNITKVGAFKVRVDSVEPGSAADRAGIRPGDQFWDFGGDRPIHPRQMERLIRRAGAGSTVKCKVVRPSEGKMLDLTVTLDAMPGDPWEALTREEIISTILVESGRKAAGEIIEMMALIKQVEQSATQEMWFQMYSAVGQHLFYVQLANQMNSGEITRREGTIRGSRVLLSGIDEAFGQSGQPTLNAFNRALRQGQSVADAVETGFLEIDEFIGPVLEAAAKELGRRNEEIQFSPEFIASELGGAPEVVPSYIGVDPHSQLAGLMLRADVLGKSLINRPELSASIPAYQTEFSYSRSHPDPQGGSTSTSVHRMWISIESVDLTRSNDAHTLEIDGIKMRFNIRELEGGRDLPGSAGGYEELLTSIYEPLAAEFPVLHELSEAGKLAAVARWLKALKPGLTLPAEQRVRWDGPETVPGLIYLTWATRAKAGVPNVSVMARGGIWLVPPIGKAGPVNELQMKRLIPSDPMVVDLRDVLAGSGGVQAEQWVSIPTSDGAVRLGGMKPRMLREPEFVGLIVDCAEVKVRLDRMIGDLPDKRKALRTLQTRIRKARADSSDAFKKTKKTFVNEALKFKDHIFKYAKQGKALRKTLEALRKRMPSLDLKEGAKWKDRLEELEKFVDEMDQNADKLLKLHKYFDIIEKDTKKADEFNKRSASLMERIEALNDSFVKSGLAEDLGVNLSKYIGGPAGEIAFRLAHLTLYVGVDLTEALIITKKDLAQYERSFAIQRKQYYRILDKIAELQWYDRNHCQGK